MTGKSGGDKTKRGRKKVAATIYDVAAKAGVSKTTVSRVLNGESNVNAKTRAAVKKTIKALQYYPSRAARNLASQAEFRIGLLYNNPSVAYFSELLVGALEGSGRVGAQLVVDKCTPGDLKAARAAVRNLVKGGLNGMLLTAPISKSASTIGELTAEGVSIVGVALGKFRNDVCCVGIDDFAAAYEMTRYLIGLGHRKIGFVKGHPAYTTSGQRYLGFLAALKDAGGQVEKPTVVQGYNSYRSGLEAGELLLSRNENLTAIFACNDDMASAVMSAAHHRDLKVPQDVSVVGFDDTIAGSVWPALTTIRQPISEIGAKAIEVIVKNIALSRTGRNPSRQNYLIAHQLIVRESAAPPRS